MFTLGLALINHNTLLYYHAQGVFSHVELPLISSVNSSRMQLTVSCTQATLLNSCARIETSSDHFPSSTAFFRCSHHMRVIEQQQLLYLRMRQRLSLQNSSSRAADSICSRKTAVPTQVEQSYFMHCCDTPYE